MSSTLALNKSKMIPKSNTPEAAALIEKVLDERYHPCNPAAAARAGYEAAYREFMKSSEAQSSDKDPDWQEACDYALNSTCFPYANFFWRIPSSDINPEYYVTTDWVNVGCLTDKLVTINQLEYLVGVAMTPINGCFIDPRTTTCGHVRYLNKYIPMLDGTKKWAGVFSGAPVVSDKWHCLTKGATLFTGDGIEDVEENSYYRVLESESGKSVKILLRKAEYSYPDQKWFLNLIQNQGNINES